MRRGLAAFQHTLAQDPRAVVLPLVIFVATFLIGSLIRRTVLRALDAWSKRTGRHGGLILIQALRGPFLIWSLILAVHLGMQASDLPRRYTQVGAEILLVLWVCSLTLMCMRLVGDLVRLYGEQIPGAVPVTTLTRNLAQIAVVILGASLLLKHFDLSLAPILTALGVGGLAVALALQDTLSNLFGGFYVAVARQVRPGDYIKLNTGEEGYVNDIGWRCTTIRALANNMVIVPNAKLSQAIVTNFSLPEKRMGSNLQVGVGVECDPDQVERILVEIGKQGALEIPGLLADPAPSVAFEPGFTESGLGFSLNYQVADFGSQTNVRNELRRRVLRRFRAEGIGTPFPTRTVYMHPEKSSAAEPEKSGAPVKSGPEALQPGNSGPL
jgi:small-conductance mechanosensitive channel